MIHDGPYIKGNCTGNLMYIKDSTDFNCSVINTAGRFTNRVLIILVLMLTNREQNSGCIGLCCCGQRR